MSEKLHGTKNDIAADDNPTNPKDNSTWEEDIANTLNTKQTPEMINSSKTNSSERGGSIE